MGKPIFDPIRDFISGVIMAATSIPQLVAYAETVGYASFRGLATAGPNLLAWGFATGSPYLNCGVTSITALMAKADLGGESFLTEHGEEEYVKLVAAYSLWVGLASILLAIVGFGKLAALVPKNVRTGFKWGCSMGVVGSAIPNGLLANGSSELKRHVANSPLAGWIVQYLKAHVPAATGAVTITNILYAIANPHLWGIIPALLFFICTYFVMQGPKFLPKSLPPGTEVILATAAATALSMLTDYPGAVVGEIPQLESDAGIRIGDYIRIPVEVLDFQDLMKAPLVDQFGGSYLMLMITATLFAAVNFLSIMGIASGFEAEDDIQWSAPRELAAQGLACGVAGMTGSAPVSGSMSRSLVARMTGSTSQLTCIITALIWIYLMPYMSIMSPTPKAALSAIIISAVIKGVVFPKELMNMRGTDLIIGWGTGIATAMTSPTVGFSIGLVLALTLGSIGKNKSKEKIN